MGLQLPSGLVQVLHITGVSWPESDEVKLFEIARAWSGLAADLATLVDQADRAAGTAWQGNSGAASAAYRDTWLADHGPSPQLRLGTIGAEIIAAGLTVCAATVLALKLSAAAQLAVLAMQMSAAVATAVTSGGASLLAVPALQYSTRLLLDQLLNQAIATVLHE
jgi:hypothetical protein